MHRFYIPTPHIVQNQIELRDPALVHQFARVLRCKVGTQAILFDGNSTTEYVVEITAVEREKIIGQIIEQRVNPAEPATTLTLFQALPKKPALFEEILQHGTEIGISHFVPILSARTEVQKIRNMPRLQKILIEATEQSNRTSVPTLSEPITFDQALEHIDGIHIIGDSFGTPPLLNALLPTIRSTKEVGIWIGPEGGFTATEISAATEKGIQAVSLGTRILRLETAGVAIASAILLG